MPIKYYTLNAYTIKCIPSTFLSNLLISYLKCQFRSESFDIRLDRFHSLMPLPTHLFPLLYLPW